MGSLSSDCFMALAVSSMRSAYSSTLPPSGVRLTPRESRSSSFTPRSASSAAMRAWRRHARGWLWRPLLDVPREELLAYAQTHGLEWVDDPANLDPAFDRNFLRHRVLPLLRERWPHAGDALARAASLQAEAIDLLDGTAPRISMALLEADIARQLIAAAHRLSRDLAESGSDASLSGDVDAVAEENPESIAAAAARIAARFFQRSLREVCGIYRDEPEYFEYLLMSATHVLEGDA